MAATAPWWLSVGTDRDLVGHGPVNVVVVDAAQVRRPRPVVPTGGGGDSGAEDRQIAAGIGDPVEGVDRTNRA